MKLKQVEVEGYRSIKDKLVMHIDQRVTVLLGANDHGKTNLLGAFQHLNAGHGFDRERDLNWDCEDSAKELPSITFEFQLSDAEQETITAMHNRHHRVTAIKESLDYESRNLEDTEKSLRQLLTCLMRQIINWLRTKMT